MAHILQTSELVSNCQHKMTEIWDGNFICLGCGTETDLTSEEKEFVQAKIKHATLNSLSMGFRIDNGNLIMAVESDKPADHPD